MALSLITQAAPSEKIKSQTIFCRVSFLGRGSVSHVCQVVDPELTKSTTGMKSLILVVSTAAVLCQTTSKATKYSSSRFLTRWGSHLVRGHCILGTRWSWDPKHSAALEVTKNWPKRPVYSLKNELSVAPCCYCAAVFDFIESVRPKKRTRLQSPTPALPAFRGRTCREKAVPAFFPTRLCPCQDGHCEPIGLCCARREHNYQMSSSQIKSYHLPVIHDKLPIYYKAAGWSKIVKVLLAQLAHYRLG